ncbi:MAG: lysylphosphatidylglycerol synthase transmembrane domain-containing protein [Ardenticatenales bacterium]
MSSPAPAPPDTPPPRGHGGTWRLAIGVSISAVFVWYAVRGLDLAGFRQHVADAHYGWLVPGVAVYFVGVWARTFRWRTMLNHLVDVPMGRLFRFVCIGYMGNNVYPARAGEVLRSYVLKRETGVAMSASLATVFIERLFDGLTMLAFVLLALPFVTFETHGLDRYRPLIVATTVLFVGALGAFLALANRPATLRRLARPFVAAGAALLGVVLRPAPGGDAPSPADRLWGIIDRFTIGLESLSGRREVVLLFCTSVVIWLCETMKYWFVMHAFPDMHVSFLTLMLMNGIVNLATTIPAGPGHVGTFDAPGIAVLTAAGVAQSVATAYTVVLHVALWVPITVLGALFLWRSHVNLRQAEAALATDRAAIPPVGAGGA